MAAAGLAGYLIINSLCLFLPFVPGIAVFLFWGLVIPSTAIISTLVWFGKRGRKMEGSRPAAVVLTVLFATAGLLTLGICINIYNAI